MSEEERKLVEKKIVYEDNLLEITPELLKKTIINQNKEIERLKSNEKTLADLLDKEQKKNKKAIEYIKEEEFYLDEYNDNFLNTCIVETSKLLEILKGGGV